MARVTNSASSLFTRSYAIILALALSLFLAGNVSAQSASEITYIYDELGRLIAVVDPAGETVKYTYDVVGNLLSITRHNSSQLSIIKVLPDSAPEGTTVTIYGTGFSPVANDNTVKFNGTTAAVASATATQIVTSVPALGVTGTIPLTVTTPGGTASASFTVTSAATTAPIINVTPRYVSIPPGGQLQFSAVVTGVTGDQSVKWSVNGVEGGNAYLGTISPTGFYSSPGQPSSVFAIRATSLADPTLFGQAQVAILDPSYSAASVAPGVSVFRRVPTAAPTTGVSVLRRPPMATAPTNAVSVHRNQPSLPAAVSTLVSVRRGPTIASMPAAVVSVRIFNSSGSPQSQNVSLTNGPHISSVSPASAAKGTTFTINLTGANMVGATEVKFTTVNGVVDSNINVSGLTIASDGMSLTATVTVGASAATGRRIIIVTTGNGSSLAMEASANFIDITQ
jgi:YD repeat-containing protein